MMAGFLHQQKHGARVRVRTGRAMWLQPLPVPTVTFRVWLLVVLAAVAMAGGGSGRGAQVRRQSRQGSKVARQSRLQKRLFDRLKPRAAAASAAAGPGLLRQLGSRALQEALRECCPDVAGLAPAALLQRVRDEVLVSEVVHNFCATSVPTGRFGGRCAEYVRVRRASLVV